MAESPNSQLLIISAAKCTTKNPNTWKLPDCKIEAMDSEKYGWREKPAGK